MRSESPNSSPILPDDLGNLPPVLSPTALPGLPHRTLQPRPLLLEERMVLVGKLQHGGVGRLGILANGQ
jgi:hypothetical protein